MQAELAKLGAAQLQAGQDSHAAELGLVSNASSQFAGLLDEKIAAFTGQLDGAQAQVAQGLSEATASVNGQCTTERATAQTMYLGMFAQLSAPSWVKVHEARSTWRAQADKFVADIKVTADDAVAKHGQIVAALPEKLDAVSKDTVEQRHKSWLGRNLSSIWNGFKAFLNGLKWVLLGLAVLSIFGIGGLMALAIVGLVGLAVGLYHRMKALIGAWGDWPWYGKLLGIVGTAFATVGDLVGLTGMLEGLFQHEAVTGRKMSEAESVERFTVGALTAITAGLLKVFMPKGGVGGGRGAGRTAGELPPGEVPGEGTIGETGTETPASSGEPTSTPQAKPEATAAPESQTAEPVAEPKPAETQPEAPKPADTEPAKADPVETKPAETPSEIKPADATPAENKPAETKPPETKPAENKPTENKPSDPPATSTQSTSAKSPSTEGDPAAPHKKPNLASESGLEQGPPDTTPGGDVDAPSTESPTKNKPQSVDPADPQPTPGKTAEAGADQTGKETTGPKREGPEASEPSGSTPVADLAVQIVKRNNGSISKSLPEFNRQGWTQAEMIEALRAAYRYSGRDVGNVITLPDGMAVVASRVPGVNRPVAIVSKAGAAELGSANLELTTDPAAPFRAAEVRGADGRPIGTGKPVVANYAERLAELSKDHDHGGKVTAASTREAVVVLELEAQGKIKGPVRRPVRGDGHSGDFVDADGVDWDVKAPKSRGKIIEKATADAKAANRKPPNMSPDKPIRGEYNTNEVLTEIKGELKAGENVIIDGEGLTPADLQALRTAVEADPALAGKVLFHE